MDLSNAGRGTATEIVRQAEILLEAQLTLAIAADDRATSLAGTFCVAGTAIVAGLITLVGTHPAMTDALPIILGGIASSGMFLWAALVCVRTTLPADFGLVGNEPKNWEEPVTESARLTWMLINQAENYQAHLEANDQTLHRNAKGFRRGALWGVAAPFAGLVIWLLALVGEALARCS
jgi:hypothetical protein